MFLFLIWWQIFPGLILSDIKPAKKMKFKTVCYLLVQLMHCRKMFKAEIPFSNVMNCEDGDKVYDLCLILTCLVLFCACCGVNVHGPDTRVQCQFAKVQTGYVCRINSINVKKR